MTKHSVAAIILAAGKGTRMRSDRHKVLHPIGGRPMIDHLLAGLSNLSIDRSIMVVGAQREQLQTALKDRNVDFVVQDQQLGTGHAVQCALPKLKGFAGAVLVLYGDTPLICATTLQAMLQPLNTGDGVRPAAVVLGFRTQNPGQYGRLVMGKTNILERIVEYKDATPDERAISLCNSGVMAFDGAVLPQLLDGLTKNNAKGEYYLTDAVALARQAGHPVRVVEAGEAEVQGVNSREDLARAEYAFQEKMRRKAMEQGATLIDPKTVYFSFDTRLSQDVLIEPNVVFGPGVEVEEKATIRAFSHLERTKIGKGATIGPYARLRPGTKIGEAAKVGNFVEIKNADIGKGAKASHLSYIGDAQIGANANIGAGTITCNYDGFSKYRTIIGKDSFIGSNTALVAPVQIGDGAMIGAGSTITRDVSDDALALSRPTQEERPAWAKRFRKRKLDKKQKTESTD